MSSFFGALGNIVNATTQAVGAVGGGIRNVIDSINRPLDDSDQSSYRSNDYKQRKTTSHNKQQSPPIVLNPSVHRKESEPSFSVNPMMLAKVDNLLIVQSPSTDSAFKKQMEFVAKSLRVYDSDDVFTMVIVVGLDKHSSLCSSSFKDQLSFEEEIHRSQYIGQCVDVSTALQVASENISRSYRGRSGVKKVAVIMNNTDYNDNIDESAAINEVNKIKAMVNETVVISAGKSNRRFLEQLASKNKNVLSYWNKLKLFKKGIKQLQNTICTIAPKYDLPADILFIIDSSSRIFKSYRSYNLLLNLVVGITEHFNIGPADAEFSAMLVSDTPQMLFYLATKAHCRIRKIVLKAPYLKGGSNIAAALTEARENALKINARSQNHKIAIVITDGCSDNKSKTENEAILLHASGVRVIAIGVGDDVNQEELKAIASNHTYVVFVDSYDVLKTMSTEISELMLKLSTDTSLKPYPGRMHDFYRNPPAYRVAGEPSFSVNPKMLAKVDTHLIVRSPSTDSAFKEQMEFVAKSTREYDRDDVAFVVIVVGLDKHSSLCSSSFQSQSLFENALHSTPYHGRCDSVSRTLKEARENYISSYSGRPGVKKVAVILNNSEDGHNGDENAAINEANKIKKIVSETVVISVGKSNRTFLEQLASKKEHALSYSNARELNEKGIGQLKMITCTIAPKYDPPADILFIIDSSGSIGPENYIKELNFVVGVTEYFNIGSTNAEFSAIVFSDHPQTLFYFATKAHSSIKRTVLQSQYFARSTDTAGALKEARLNTLRTNARHKHQKIVIVITDGCSNDKSDTETEAHLLKASGVRVIAIGVGNVNKEELKAIATNQMHVFSVDSYDVLETIYKKIVEAASEGQVLLQN